jgi:hypothetical protein
MRLVLSIDWQDLRLNWGKSIWHFYNSLDILFNVLYVNVEELYKVQENKLDSSND